MADLPHLAKMLLATLLPVARHLDVAVGADDGENPGIIAAADQVLRDDQVVRGVVENARPRATALAGRAGLGVANVPYDVVVDRVLARVHLHVHGGADRQDVGEDVAGDAAVGVVDVPPGGVGMAHVPYRHCGGTACSWRGGISRRRLPSPVRHPPSRTIRSDCLPPACWWYPSRRYPRCRSSGSCCGARSARRRRAARPRCCRRCRYPGPRHWPTRMVLSSRIQ